MRAAGKRGGSYVRFRGLAGATSICPHGKAVVPAGSCGARLPFARSMPMLRRQAERAARAGERRGVLTGPALVDYFRAMARFMAVPISAGL